MMTKMIAPIALALVLGALPAGAASRHHETENQRVKTLAHRLEGASGELYRDAARSARQRSSREWLALQALLRFDRRVELFRDQVVSHGIHHPHTRLGFQRLEFAFATAKARRSDLRQARRLRDEFEQVERLMRRLDLSLADRIGHERPQRHAAVRVEAQHPRFSFRVSY